MADQRKALDERTRKLSSGGKIGVGEEHAAYQESQQQLLAIQAEQKQNLAVARAESKASFDNNQTLAQAAELGAASAIEAEQAALSGAAQQPQLNPATQAVLSKYGMGQPKFQKTQSHNQQITKQNITINNNTTVNTTNDVKVPANIGGPLQGRPVQFKSAAVASAASQGGNSVGRFKSWISSAFARQNEEGARRDREYRNRENSLTRSANRMMRKLEDVGKTIGTRMDPRKIGSTWQSQLKTLFMLFGFGYIASNWTKILERVARIEKWFKEDLAKFLGIGSFSGEESGFKTTIKSLLGIPAGSNEGIFEGLRKLLYDGEESLWGYIKLWFSNLYEERSKAIKMIKFPELDLMDITGSIGKLGMYLGDLIGALVGGTEGIRQHVANQLKYNADNSSLAAINRSGYDGTMETQRVILTNANGEKKDINVDIGARALFRDIHTGKRKHYGLTKYSLDSNNELTGSPESTFAQSVELISAYEKAMRGETVDTTVISRGLERLYNAAKKRTVGGVVVDEGLLSILNTNQELFEKLKREHKIKLSPFHFEVREKTHEDYIRENADPKAAAVNAGFEKYLLDEFAPKASDLQDKVAIAKGTFDGINTATKLGLPSMFIPSITTSFALGGAVKGWYDNSAVGRANNAASEARYNRNHANKYRYELVPGPAPKEGDLKTIYKWTIFPSGIQDIANYLSYGRQKEEHEADVDINLSNPEYVSGIQSSIKKIAGEANYRKDLKKLKITPNPNLPKPEGFIQHYEDDIKLSENDKKLTALYEQVAEINKLEQKQKEKEENYKANWRPGRIANYVGDKVSSAVDWVTDKVNSALGISGKYVPGNATGDTKKIMAYTVDYLIKKGFTPEEAAGIAGALHFESGGYNTKAVNPSSGATGLAQWLDRKNAVLSHFGVNDIRDLSFGQQLDYVIHEYNTTEKEARTKLKNARTAAEAGIAHERHFERPGEAAMIKFSGDIGGRSETALKAYNDTIKSGETITDFYHFKGKPGGSANSKPVTGSSSVENTVDQTWINRVNEVADWYSKNVHVYDQEGSIKTPWGNFRADCSGFVSACLTAYGINATDNPGSILFGDPDSEIGKKLKSANFRLIKYSSLSSSKPYDILVAPDKHVEIYCGKDSSGKHKSVGWGEVKDRNAFPGGPPWPSYDTDYKYIWRNGSGSNLDINNNVKDNEKPQSFYSLLMSSIKDMLFGLGSGFSFKTEGLGQIITDTGDKIIKEMRDIFKGKVKPHKGPITSEFTDYNSYKKLSGEIPTGLNKDEWKDYVYKSTGFLPSDLKSKLDVKEEEKRQIKIQENSKNASTFEKNLGKIPKFTPTSEISSEKKINVPYSSDILSPVKSKDDTKEEKKLEVPDLRISGPIMASEMSESQKRDLWKSNYKTWMAENTKGETSGETTIVSNANETVTANTMENPVTNNMFSKFIAGTDIEPKLPDNGEIAGPLMTLNNKAELIASLVKISAQGSANTVDAISTASANLANALSASNAQNKSTKPSKELNKGDMTGDIIGDINIT